MLKIIFNSPCNFTTSSELLTRPIGLSYIKHYCEKNFPCTISIVSVLDQNILEAEQPDIVGISCYAATFGTAANLAKLCKKFKKKIYVVAGGEQITTLPHLLTQHMDIGVRGEGEHIFLELLKIFDNGWNLDQLKLLDGVVFRDENNKLIIREPAPPLASLDDLPIPDFLVDNKGADILCLMSSRGCPYRCVFCATGWHKSVRWMSPERIIETIKFHVEKYPKLKRVKFWDDLFTVKFKRVEQFVELAERTGLTQKISFTVCTRADHINEELLNLFKRMNCTHVSMGLESGCDSTLKYIQKGCSVSTNRRAVRLLADYKINSESSFIIGFPYEKNNDIQKTYDFIQHNPIKKIQVFLPIPYPGTKLWNYAIEKGLVEEDMVWEKLDLIATMNDPKFVLDDFIVLSEELSRKELYYWLKKFERLRMIKNLKYSFVLIFTKPSIIFQRLKREVRFNILKLKNN